MMITIKSPREIQRMRTAGRIAAQARGLGREMLRDGITTAEIRMQTKGRSVLIPVFEFYK